MKVRASVEAMFRPLLGRGQRSYAGHERSRPAS